MNVRARALATLLGLAFAVVMVGCGSPAQSTAAPGPGGTGAHVFPDLEALIPAEIGGQALEHVSLPADPDLQDAKTLAVLEQLDKTPADLQLASASLEGLDISIGALRVVGTDANDAIAAFQAVDEADPAHRAVYGTATKGGKSVVTRTLDGEVAYIYPYQDILFFVSGRDDLVTEALTRLP